ITSGKEPKGRKPVGAKHRHPLGLAADLEIRDREGKLVTYHNTSAEEMKRITTSLRRNGITGIGIGKKYMGGTRWHLDIANSFPSWGDGKKGGKALVGSIRAVTPAFTNSMFTAAVMGGEAAPPSMPGRHPMMASRNAPPSQAEMNQDPTFTSAVLAYQDAPPPPVSEPAMGSAQAEAARAIQMKEKISNLDERFDDLQGGVRTLSETNRVLARQLEKNTEVLEENSDRLGELFGRIKRLDERTLRSSPRSQH
ncbi:MAG: hypothetical protein AAGB11_01540, partial [Pseudomonadota bacterium]